MHRTLMLCALGLCFGSAVGVASQALPFVELSAELRARVQNEQLMLVSSLRGLPLGVRGALQALFGSRELDIAEPGAEFQVSDAAINARLPIRRLSAAGCSYQYCLVYYERGGVDHSWRVALFRWTPDDTRFEWGGAAPAGLRTIDDVRRAILSGAIKGSGGIW